jgi:hypothetical protein
MNEYVLFFRMDILTPEAQPGQEQMETYMNQWQEWIDSMVDQYQLVGGNHLSTDGKVLKSDKSETDSPYALNNESIAGYLIVRANDIDEAVAIARKCPILLGTGTSVEVRQIANR